jgi:hypothetical protein
VAHVLIGEPVSTSPEHALGNGATSGIGETMNFIGETRLASGQKLVEELCSAQDQARTSKTRESAVTPNTKSIAA